MNAVIVTAFGSPEVMKYTDMPIPTIKYNQVLIKVEKCSVNYADVKSRYGNKGKQTFPFIPGLDCAGVIVEIGKDVTDFKIGDRVIAFPSMGSYAEYVAADTNLTYLLPENIPFEIGAACPTVSLLSHKLLVDIARLEDGETILIHSAAGGVGTTSIQMAKLLGAKTVIGTVGHRDKVQIALDAGADHVICYEEEDFSAKANELTDGKGVDIVLDSIAGDTTEKSLNCLAPFGRLLQFGNSSGKAGIIKTSDLHSSCRSVLGYSLGTTRKNRPETLKDTAAQVLKLISEGSLHIHIGHQFPLSQAAMAHELIESRQSTGKILLDCKN